MCFQAFFLEYIHTKLYFDWPVKMITETDKSHMRHWR